MPGATVPATKSQRVNSFMQTHRIWFIVGLIILLVILISLFLWLHMRQKDHDKADDKEPLIPDDEDIDDDHKFTMQCVKAHNLFRKKHGTPDVSYSSDLAQLAAERAEKLVKLDKLTHLPDNKGYGENLYMVIGSLGDCNQATQSWYDEFQEFHYDFSNPTFSFDTGHATQVVWSNTKRIGCAQRSLQVKQLPKQYTVCMYDPAGNILGEFKGNVPAPK